MSFYNKKGHGEMETKTIKHFNSQKCVGYSTDFSETFFSCIIEFSDGSIENHMMKAKNGGELKFTEDTPQVLI